MSDRRNEIFTYMRQDEIRQRAAQKHFANAVRPRRRNIIIRHIRRVYYPTLVWLGHWLVRSGERVQQYSNALDDLNVFPAEEVTQSRRNA